MSIRVKAIESIELTVHKSMPPQYTACVKWTAHRGGWSRLRLEATPGPKDGFRNLALVADWSEVGTAPVSSETSHFYLGVGEPGERGVRIHAQDNALEVPFEAGDLKVAGGVDAFPWSSNGDATTQLRLRDLVGRPIRVLKPGDVVLPVIVPGRVTIYVDNAHRATQVGVEPGPIKE